MQSGARLQLAWQREHLWLALQGLGFEPGVEAAVSGKILSHVTFGENMFDKPNKDAFYVVFHFLFAKLDSVRCKEAFRYCWPPLDKKKDAEFRKACCEWLRRISEDAGCGFPQVVASIFLSPGGPKFLHLLYHFARYVILQHIKKDVDGANIFVPEALQPKIQDPQKALARNKVARLRYFKVLQREKFLIGEYQKKAQLLIKQIRDMRSEHSTLQNQHKIAESLERDQKMRTENIHKVRCMWKSVLQMLEMIEKEVDVVEAVVRGNVDQSCMDGSNVTLNIPNLLVTRIESEMHRLQMENVYEAGKINLITVLQLLNEALKMVREERYIHDCKGIRLDLPYLNGKVKFESDVLSRLTNMRQKIKREDIVTIDKSVADKEREWENKWERILGKSPFSFFKGLNPVLELQPPMAPFSFDPATEEILKSSLFLQYPASLPEFSHLERPSKDLNRDHNGEFLRRLIGGTVLTPTGRNSLSSLDKTTPIKRRMSLNEKDFWTPTPNINDQRVFQRTPGSAMQKRRSDVSWTPASNSPLLHTPAPNKQDPKSMSRQHLAQQVAEYIVSDSAKPSGGRAKELDDLIGILSSDPFLSRKEIPRTPENLISDIRSSWRKAIQSEESSDITSPVSAPCMDTTVENESAHCSQIDLSMACFLSTSHVSDQNDCSGTRIPASAGSPVHSFPTEICPPASTEQKSKINLPKQVGFSLSLEDIENPLDKKTKYFVLENNSFSNLKDTTLHNSASGQEHTSTHSTLSWHSSNMIYDSSSDSHDVIQFGILHETLPENAGNVSLNSTVSLGGDDEHLTKSEILDNDGDMPIKEQTYNSIERKMDIQSIRSRYEAIKRNFFTPLTDVEHHIEHSSSNKTFTKHKSESSLTLSSDVYSPAEKGFMLGTEYLTTPSPKDRKLSLPQLISFSPLSTDTEKKDLSDVFESQGELTC
ncbi:hypothetical protein GDO86_001329 [Hymenochirus boettgeri]|uniref:HAUS augmin-like complex subunit 6 N-terminal domain-containing protein n=1 Tax=Hymenochirus boettgeri TaxID=247094 RepID=A0A8T2KGN3_9PIPI|nr:hypothetical protein GDO86_001329 [Hymenochirus boettgeri]